jgi:hypothetical protein
MHKLDHIVLGCNTLQEGTDYVEKKLGLTLSEIGYHLHMGTHNRVIKISENIYLEVIAIDPNANKPKHFRWFNLDNKKQQARLKKSPQIIGYVIENQNPDMLKFYNPFFEASRGNYCWEFAMPKSDDTLINDELIESGLVPSLIKWKSKKPVYKMLNNHFELEKIKIELTQNHIEYKSYINYLGDVEKLEYIFKDKTEALSLNKYPKFNIIINDKKKNSIISL